MYAVDIGEMKNKLCTVFNVTLCSVRYSLKWWEDSQMTV